MSTAENLDNKIKEFWPRNGPASQEIEKYVKKYSKEKIVIKCGGRVLLDPNLFNNFINDVTILKKLGLTPIVVHGGGPRIKKKLDELNIETKFIMGLRVTDERVIKIVENVMIEFNKEIVDALEKRMCKAKSVTIKENNVIYAAQKNKELGFVGKPTRIDDTLIKNLIRESFIPIISPMGLDEKKQTSDVYEPKQGLGFLGYIFLLIIIGFSIVGVLRTFENDLLNYFPKTEYIYELLDKQLEFLAETVKNMIVIVNHLLSLY